MQVNSITDTNTVNSADSVPNPQQTLTQNDFLQLLVAQMENQDPLNPQSDTEMAAQMAQFTSLQQTTEMSASMSMLQADSLIGSTVTLQLDSAGDTTTGVVSGVELGSASSDGTPQIVVNGVTYDLGQVLSVTPTVAAQNSSTSSPSSTTN
jgi:flagellar basal-body rod modification protein FlgD